MNFCPKISVLLLLTILISSCKVIEVKEKEKEKEKAVRFELFNNGLNKNIIYGSGFHVFPIWDRGIIYNVDTLSNDEVFYPETSDEVQFEVYLAIQHQANPHRIGDLEEVYGHSYYHSVVVKETAKAFSGYFEKQTSESILSTDLNQLQANIYEIAMRQIRKNHVNLVALKIDKLSKS